MPKIKASLGAVSTKRPALRDVVGKLLWVRGNNWPTLKAFYDAWGAARKEVYLTAEWGTVRKLVYKRSRWVCESCKSRKAKEIHHRVRVYDDPSLICVLKNLLHVCDECHKAAHPIPVHQ